MAMSANGQTILRFLQAHIGSDYTANMIAEATGLPVKTVNGVVTMSLQKPGYAVREEREGFDKKVIVLTESGKSLNPEE
ncbi:MAG TPA: hypothetical protein DCW90_23290 [Lachnospiraceae bacterium]|nr:hypothetical protein [Lachnospiraceae bacterium]